MINIQDLQTTAQEAYKLYQANPQKAVRSGQFIRQFHDYCERELQRVGLPPAPILVKNRVRVSFGLEHSVRILGGYVDKELDVSLQSNTSGPLLAISVKSQMSSIASNMKNRFEEYVGDATNLHTRFPLLVFGFLMVVPYAVYDASGNLLEQLIDQNGQPTETAHRIKSMLQGVTGRIEPTSLPGAYEEAALLVLNFTTSPVTVHPDFPEPASNLRIDDFFDRLMSRYRQRNPYLT